VQIDPAEREEKESELMDAGFNLSHLKVVATDYFKVNMYFLYYLSMYEH